MHNGSREGKTCGAKASAGAGVDGMMCGSGQVRPRGCSLPRPVCARRGRHALPLHLVTRVDVAQSIHEDAALLIDAKCATADVRVPVSRRRQAE